MKHDENLRNIFDIEPVKQTTAIVPVIEETLIDDAEDDYILARRTMRNIIQKSERTLDDVLDLARSNEHPRTYEVAGQLIKTMSEVSKDLLTLHEQRKAIRKPIENDPAHRTDIAQQNNIVFAGSTDELLKMLNQKNVIENEPAKIIDQS
jgi:hypothetical protein